MIILSSGTLSAIVSLAAFLLLLTAYKNKIPALIMLILLISVFILSPRARQKASLIGQKKTSTFRILTWAHSLKKIKSRPLLGHGPGTSEKALCRIIWPKEAILSEKPVHSHNIFLQILLETGILGLAVISALLVIIFKNTCFYGKILIITILINNQFTFFFIDSSYTCAVTGIIMLNMKNSIPGQ
jgi:O-antigen ligase